jgi:hypothetical protein
MCAMTIIRTWEEKEEAGSKKEEAGRKRLPGTCCLFPVNDQEEKTNGRSLATELALRLCRFPGRTRRGKSADDRLAIRCQRVRGHKKKLGR